jgi:hypothetical protein
MAVATHTPGLLLLACAAWTSSAAAAAITAVFTPSGGYEVRRGGDLLLQSTRSPCAVHRDGKWCNCASGATSSSAATCSLKVTGRKSGSGTDAIGMFNRTEIQWSDEGGVVLTTAMRVYDKGEVSGGGWGESVHAAHMHARREGRANTMWASAPCSMPSASVHPPPALLCAC